MTATAVWHSGRTESCKGSNIVGVRKSVNGQTQWCNSVARCALLFAPFVTQSRFILHYTSEPNPRATTVLDVTFCNGLIGPQPVKKRLPIGHGSKCEIKQNVWLLWNESNTPYLTYTDTEVPNNTSPYR